MELIEALQIILPTYISKKAVLASIMINQPYHDL